MAAPIMSPLPVVPDGLVQHRRRVRRWGPVLALLAPGMAGLLAVVLLWGSDSTLRGMAGLVLAVVAAPLMPVLGVPATGGGRLTLSIALSAVLWMLIGGYAARVATRIPAASWPEWRREYRRLAMGASLGGVAALGLTALVLAVLAR